MLLGIVMRRITKSSELSRSKASQYSHTNTLFCPPWAFQKGKVCLYQIYSTNGQNHSLFDTTIRRYKDLETLWNKGLRGLLALWGSCMKPGGEVFPELRQFCSEGVAWLKVPRL